ncbi:MAG: Flp pilus assembly complex ATPase component TadA [Synergistaceae bacterium]|nr:Flp pilus assembly complex ATPase component TadA [Synergistaceae bacterium]
MSQGWKYLKLGDLLVNAGAITKETLDAALEEQKISRKRLGEILLKNGWLPERQLAEALSRQLDLPLVSLADHQPSREVLDVVSREVAQRLNVIPLSGFGGKIAIAMADPLDIMAIDELRMMTNAEISVNVATMSDVRQALMRFYRMQDSIKAVVTENKAMNYETSIASAGVVQYVDGVSSDDAPVVRLVSNVLEQAVKDRVSDIHLEAYQTVSKVRYRVDGVLYDYMEFPASLHPPVVSRIKVLAGIDTAEKRKSQDGRITVKVLDKHIDLRVNTLPTINGEKVVIRLFDRGASRVGLANLGLFADDVEVLRRCVAMPHGVLLVTGPTGSGKSTTLHSLLEILNRPGENVITIEDPVEYTMIGINQVQVNERMGQTFTEVLRSILRQDPDTIMVGEMRDYATTELAIRAALTGHRVLSTLHTNNAPASVVRLLDMGAPPYLISASVVAIAAQRLLRRLCDRCKAGRPLPESLARVYGLQPGIPVYEPSGCDECRSSGYKGRVAVVEIMEVNKRIKELINAKATESAIRQAAIESGMRLLVHSALRNVVAGVTSIDETLTVIEQSE